MNVFKEQPKKAEAVRRPRTPWREAFSVEHTNSTISRIVGEALELRAVIIISCVIAECSTQMCAVKSTKKLNLSPVLMKQLSSSAFCVFFVFLLTHIHEVRVSTANEIRI